MWQGVEGAGGGQAQFVIELEGTTHYAGILLAPGFGLLSKGFFSSI